MAVILHYLRSMMEKQYKETLNHLFQYFLSTDEHLMGYKLPVLSEQHFFPIDMHFSLTIQYEVNFN